MSIKAKHARARSGTGCCDVCGSQELLERHHLQGHSVDRPNSRFNVCQICPGCHASLHSGLPGSLVLEGWFMTSDGRTLLWHRRGDVCKSGNRLEVYTEKPASSD